MQKADRDICRQVERLLGYRFRKKQTLISALTHPSYRHEQDAVNCDNQRMEFLGDALLGFILADELYNKDESANEGRLTAWRSLIASGPNLAAIAESIRLGDFIYLGRGEARAGGQARKSNLADTLEALLCAVYLDGGLRNARRVFEKLFAQQLKELPAAEWTDNPKGELQTIVQIKHKTVPLYRVIEQSGPPHDARFVVEVLIDDHALGNGTGKSKQAAEKEAARHALKNISASEPDA